MTTLYELVEIVRESRERTNDVFPLPGVDDCIDFAITEAGEYLDALKRENTTYKRNRDKEHDARKEWGQCGYMIASAIIQVPTAHLDALDWKCYYDATQADFYQTMRALCDIRTKSTDLDNPEVDALDQWQAQALYAGYNPPDLLRETCAAFEAKHLQVA